MKDHNVAWMKYGVSIMSDGWTNKRNQTLMNFLVNCPVGTMFMESIDDSSIRKTGENTFELLDKFEERIREKNVVQVIVDNGSNYVLTGKILFDEVL